MKGRIRLISTSAFESAGSARSSKPNSGATTVFTATATTTETAAAIEEMKSSGGRGK
ncbi:hypothetical protein L195_g014391 [Trifolium pratense]|uniref:Uncharacterized protein n=1 Tax=Trifolium pratense TaxID=57577 RepID=A0A2K3PQS9_TRIPR|nr:hypothetical protein L195_g014391 [Trifolium pratense]